MITFDSIESIWFFLCSIFLHFLSQKSKWLWQFYCCQLKHLMKKVKEIQLGKYLTSLHQAIGYTVEFWLVWRYDQYTYVHTTFKLIMHYTARVVWDIPRHQKPTVPWCVSSRTSLLHVLTMTIMNNEREMFTQMTYVHRTITYATFLIIGNLS